MAEADRVIRLVSPQKERAVETLTSAFFDDVVFTYVFPDGEYRAASLHRLWSALLTYGLMFGEVYTTPTVSGVACWLPPGRTEYTPWRLFRTGFALPRFVLGLSSESMRRIVDIMIYSDRAHRRIVRGRYWYLSALGVDPSWQGRGIGGRLLQPVLVRADGEGVPCFLETQTERNVRFYQKHGFFVASEGEVPGHGVKLWAMLRPPRG